MGLLQKASFMAMIGEVVMHPFKIMPRWGTWMRRTISSQWKLIKKIHKQGRERARERGIRERNRDLHIGRSKGCCRGELQPGHRHHDGFSYRCREERADFILPLVLNPFPKGEWVMEKSPLVRISKIISADKGMQMRKIREESLLGTGKDGY